MWTTAWLRGILTIVIVHVLILASGSAASSVQAQGYVLILGMTYSVVKDHQPSVTSALSMDLGTMFKNITTFAVVVSVDGLSGTSVTNVSRFDFSISSDNALSSNNILRWSSFVASAASSRDPRPLNATNAAYAAYSTNASDFLTLYDSACTLVAVNSGEDQCGPFSCYGFAMVAMLACLFVGIGVGIYCCCTRCRRRSEGYDENSKSKVAPVNAMSNLSDDDDEDPFADSVHEVDIGVSRAGGDNKSDQVSSNIERRDALSSSSEVLPVTVLSKVVTSPRTRRVTIVDPPAVKRTAETQNHSMLDYSGMHSNSTSNALPLRPNETQREAQPPMLSFAEEKKQLESQAWIWQHLE